MNMYILLKMFVLCYFCNIDMYIFDKINVLFTFFTFTSTEAPRLCRSSDVTAN